MTKKEYEDRIRSLHEACMEQFEALLVLRNLLTKTKDSVWEMSTDDLHSMLRALECTAECGLAVDWE